MAIEIFVPSGTSSEEALAKTTHLCIAAHQDDIEIMAYHGILQCFGREDRWFTGVVVTNGSGSPRSGIYGDYTDERMQQIRKIEQQKAAMAGDYSAQVFLDHPSSAVKSPTDAQIVEELKEIVAKTRPRYIYTHNLADKHDTHVGVVTKTVRALRELGYAPEGFYGCEVWRNLDWLDDGEKVVFDVAGRPNLEAAVLGVFDSQIAGGKRYDLAAVGRRLANATFGASHGVDDTTGAIYGMDLLPLLQNPALDMADFTTAHIQSFADDVRKKIGGMTCG